MMPTLFLAQNPLRPLPGSRVTVTPAKPKGRAFRFPARPSKAKWRLAQPLLNSK
jgi:hypothetical protein